MERGACGGRRHKECLDSRVEIQYQRSFAFDTSLVFSQESQVLGLCQVLYMSSISNQVLYLQHPFDMLIHTLGLFSTKGPLSLTPLWSSSKHEVLYLWLGFFICSPSPARSSTSCTPLICSPKPQIHLRHPFRCASQLLRIFFVPLT